MLVPLTPDSNEPPPPPYSPHDPQSPSAGSSWHDPVQLPVRTSLRGGYIRPGPRSQVSDTSNASPASAYFEERSYGQCPALQRAGLHLDQIDHIITFTPETAREDIGFPHPAELYLNRDVTYEDWATLADFLIPPSEFPPPKKTEKAKNGRKEKTKSSSRIGDPNSRQRIEAVIAQWNEDFFGPRRIRVLADFGPMLPLPRSDSSSGLRRVSHEGLIPLPPSGSPNATCPVSYSPLPYASPSAARRQCRSTSISSTATSTISASDSSISSIGSEDLEGCSAIGVRSTLEAFRADPSKKDHLRQAINQLRETFRAQSRNTSCAEHKDLKKKYKSEIKDVKKEIKAIVKDIRSERRANRKARRAERRSHRDAERKERRSRCNDKRHHYHNDRQQSTTQIPSSQSFNPSQGRPWSQQSAACSSDSRTIDWGSCTRNRPDKSSPTGQTSSSISRDPEIEQASATFPTVRFPSTPQTERTWTDIGRERAAAAESRARAAESRSQDTVLSIQSRDYGREGRARAREAVERASAAASGGRRDWNTYGRDRATEAMARAERVARGPVY